MKYARIKHQVNLFKVFSAELGDPSILFRIERLGNPVLFGVRIKIINIKQIVNINQIILNIYYIVLNLQKTTSHLLFVNGKQ